ncbi:wax ester/triacylglycerol synthase domain-containing protein [Gryllotalpicola koreensis]|uniref:O-acyltransferase WSD1-like N-terminal domain-containing protein n=1 Tax=Gryllotalpicola koreensis TaxID=993086 RepID=A0ABP7ZTX6_9MICO
MSRRTQVELMRTLDEKFIRTSIEFETTWPTATLVIDGAPFRGADGAIDRERVASALLVVGRRFTETQLKITDAPLGVTTPLWVPAGPLDRDYHLGWFPRVPAAAEEPALFSGAANVPRRRDRPLWRYTVIERADGDLAVVGSVQHALGDALFALKFMDALMGDGSAEVAALGPAPRTRVGGLLVVWGRWLRARSGPRDAWREYWRKPFRKRLTRWGGRLLRPLRNRAIDRRGLRAGYAPPMAAAYWNTELASAAELARRLGGSISDLVIALALRATAAADGGALAEVSVAVPVSRRSREGAAVRNSIVMLRIAVPRGLPLAAAVAAVHAQIAAFARTGDGDTAPAESGAYASYLPYRRERAAIAGAAVRRVLLWPVPMPGSRLGLFGSSYAGELSFTALCGPGIDPAVVRAVVEQELTDAAAALAAEQGVPS